MKPNVIIALLVGGVIGFAVGKMVGPAANSGTPTPTAAIAAPGAPGKPAMAARGPGGDDQTVFKVPIEGAPIHGNVAAPVTIVEFSDYQCPFCGRANGTIKQIEDDYGQKVRVVMRQFPLSFHQNARNAALAALAAGEQGKYWEMHEKLFGNQQALDQASLEKYATELGLNLEKFKADMQSQKLGDIISRDQAAGSQVGVTGTPAFFINGRKISGAQPIQNFKTVIDQELGKANAMIAAGTKPEAVYAAILEKAQNAPAPAPQAPQAPPPAQVRNVTVPADAPWKGANPAKVTIVEWSDFQCPFCGRVEPTLKQIMDTYPNDVKLVWRNQPLPFHANAKPAAEAAMAANEQGKFWQMHDKLFQNQQALDRASMEKYAQEIGLDMNKFKAALDSGKFRAAIEADSAAGNEVGANGTPTFYINGHQLVGAQPFPSFKQMIDDELAKANKLIAEGVKPQDVYARAIADGMKAAPAPAPAPAAAPAPAKVVENIDISGAPVRGPKNAPVTIVEWSDFQCPFCGRVEPTLAELEKAYPGKVKLVWRNQPLPFHQNAKPAAMAAMAANEQGKFWQMHDKLFENQQALDRASLEKYAQEIGLDMNKFKAALDSNKFDAEITKDSNQGMQVGANGTPTFFINGRMLVGAQPIDQFKAIIDDELKKKH